MAQSTEQQQTLAHTETYTIKVPANPYLICAQCGARVEYWAVSPEGQPGHAQVNEPCGHRADYYDTCPSWGPIDGCMCDLTGPVSHRWPAPPRTPQGRDQGPL